MGGCCSSRKRQLHGTPVYHYCPPPSEEHAALQSHDGVTAILSSGSLLVDLNLNLSVPDTYQPPPTPLSYDVVLGRPQSTDVVVTGHPNATDDSLRKPGCMDSKEAICRMQPSSLPQSPRKLDIETLKPDPRTGSTTDDDDDACPTCLEEYDAENPKIVTKCNHHFHLACILEWMERSDTCPVCNQEMIYEAL